MAIYLLFRLVKDTEASRSASDRRPTPLEILEERFAKGDISGEEYRERKGILLEEDLERRAGL